MNNITNLLTKYTKFISREGVIKDYAMKAFKEIFDVEIKKSEMKVVRDSLILSCHPALIYRAKQYEDQIIQEVNKNPHGFIVKVIR